MINAGDVTITIYTHRNWNRTDERIAEARKHASAPGRCQQKGKTCVTAQPTGHSGHARLSARAGSPVPRMQTHEPWGSARNSRVPLGTQSLRQGSGRAGPEAAPAPLTGPRLQHPVRETPGDGPGLDGASAPLPSASARHLCSEEACRHTALSTRQGGRKLRTLPCLGLSVT